MQHEITTWIIPSGRMVVYPPIERYKVLAGDAWQIPHIAQQGPKRLPSPSIATTGAPVEAEVRR